MKKTEILRRLSAIQHEITCMNDIEFNQFIENDSFSIKFDQFAWPSDDEQEFKWRINIEMSKIFRGKD